jgi:hypothetical protein
MVVIGIDLTQAGEGVELLGRCFALQANVARWEELDAAVGAGFADERISLLIVIANDVKLPCRLPPGCGRGSHCWLPHRASFAPFRHTMSDYPQNTLIHCQCQGKVLSKAIKTQVPGAREERVFGPLCSYYLPLRMCVTAVAPVPPKFWAMPTRAPGIWQSPALPRSCWATSTIW